MRLAPELGATYRLSVDELYTQRWPRILIDLQMRYGRWTISSVVR